MDRLELPISMRPAICQAKPFAQRVVVPEPKTFLEEEEPQSLQVEAPVQTEEPAPKKTRKKAMGTPEVCQQDAIAMPNDPRVEVITIKGIL